MLLLLLVNCLFSLTYIIINFALQYTTPLELIALRMLFASTISFLYQLARNQKWPYISYEDVAFLAATSLFHMNLNFLLEAYALEHVSALFTSIIYLLSPFINAVFEWYTIHKHLLKRQLFILLLSFFLSLSLLLHNNKSAFFITSEIVGYGSLLLSIIFSILGWQQVKILRKRYSLIIINAYTALFSGIICILFLVLQNGPFFFQFVCQEAIIAAVLLALIGNLLGYNLYDTLLSHYSLTTIFLSESITPGILILYNRFFFKKEMEYKALLVTLILSGLTLIFSYLEKTKNKKYAKIK
jgi:drug/metabolite transporter (DMT)-like permease